MNGAYIQIYMCVEGTLFGLNIQVHWRGHIRPLNNISINQRLEMILIPFNNYSQNCIHVYSLHWILQAVPLQNSVVQTVIVLKLSAAMAFSHYKKFMIGTPNWLQLRARQTIKTHTHNKLINGFKSQCCLQYFLSTYDLHSTFVSSNLSTWSYINTFRSPGLA